MEPPVELLLDDVAVHGVRRHEDGPEIHGRVLGQVGARGVEPRRRDPQVVGPVGPDGHVGLLRDDGRRVARRVAAGRVAAPGYALLRRAAAADERDVDAAAHDGLRGRGVTVDVDGGGGVEGDVAREPGPLRLQHRAAAEPGVRRVGAPSDGAADDGAPEAAAGEGQVPGDVDVLRAPRRAVVPADDGHAAGERHVLGRRAEAQDLHVRADGDRLRVGPGLEEEGGAGAAQGAPERRQPRRRLRDVLLAGVEDVHALGPERRVRLRAARRRGLAHLRGRSAAGRGGEGDGARDAHGSARAAPAGSRAARSAKSAAPATRELWTPPGAGCRWPSTENVNALNPR